MDGENQNPEVQAPPEPLVPVVSEEESWMTVLVNNTSLLKEGYVPELVTVNSAGYKFDARAAEDLQAMLQAAREEGLSPMICSSYRSWERQTTLFEKQVVKQQNTGLPYEEACEKAKTVVAFPGTSEHQTGLAADIVATSHQLLDDSQEQTAEQQWLMEHCWEYGFILRYPKDKSDITGIIYEPWHYRYVGHEVAQYIHENGLCLEEYWQQVEEQDLRQAQQANEPKQYEQG
ncbi:MAG: M15 family metallopeptidase [Peptococcaceae bacterium]|nr:M15 family metallopeptidase [Peptococcaceae bacterium]